MFDTWFGGRKVSKCKEVIRRVQHRLKLLRNKRTSIARHMRYGAAALISSGHSERALDRIERLYNDLRLLSVYELLDEFCELVSSNLSYILGNKDVPGDINEAVSSLIFASARCGDIPELGGIRKLFGELYGQRYTMAAVELLPGNLVNNQIKEKLSRKPVPENSIRKLFDEIATDCSTKPDVLVEVEQDNEQSWSWNQVLAPTHYNQVGCYQIQQYDPEESLSISNAGLSRSSTCVSSSIVDGSSPIYEEENGTICLVDWEERASTSSSSSSLDQFPEENLIYLDDIESMREEQGNEDQRLVVFKPSLEVKEESLEDGHVDNVGQWNRKRQRKLISWGSQSHVSSDNLKRESEELRTRHEEGAVVYDVFTYTESEEYGGSSSPYLRPSFVHPKLPDYFDFEAKFMALERASKQNKATGMDNDKRIIQG